MGYKVIKVPWIYDSAKVLCVGTNLDWTIKFVFKLCQLYGSTSLENLGIRSSG